MFQDPNAPTFARQGPRSTPQGQARSQARQATRRAWRAQNPGQRYNGPQGPGAQQGGALTRAQPIDFSMGSGSAFGGPEQNFIPRGAGAMPMMGMPNGPQMDGPGFNLGAKDGREMAPQQNQMGGKAY